MNRKALLLALALLPLPAWSQVYKWQDESGRWHYSDSPRPGAVELDLPPIQTYQAPPSERQLQALSRSSAEQSAPEPEISYARVEFAAPGPEATIRNAIGEVGVVLVLEPGLREGHTVRLLLDGQPAAEPVASTAFTLMNVDRGAHQLSAEILDARGRVVARAGPQVFYMHRPSRLH
ncbi:MAG: DUF4124 domain-containing protein [Xanthomonadaceae bacterium]|nr:DUF4124 domain-containing protein [Xanthomonadaceae bacterium]